MRQTFNLAWHEKDIKRAESYLVYVLVPTWVKELCIEMIFDRISFAGVPLPPVRTWAGHLASPRLEEDQEGIPHPLEQKLIRTLQIKADLAHNPLLEVVPTTTFRPWSKLDLSKEQREILLRAGGAIR